MQYRSVSPASALAIVDANSFYASCFAAFDATLAHRPVVVLSNNDGNIIARNAAAKRLGIAMGVPFFQVRELVALNDVRVFSSNHGFFADMSWRFQSLLYEYSPVVEHYSIDEAWLDIQPTAPMSSKMTLDAIGREIHQRVCALSGIPVAVGFAETKTLAKLALELAKTSPKTRGVLDLTRSPYQSIALERLPVSDVWGIGAQSTKKLNRHGIITALDLREADDQWIRKNLTATGLRTVHELRGIQCFPLNPDPPPRKLVTVSRSFGQATANAGEVRAAVAWFTARAAEKLRRADFVAARLTVWLTTDRFKDTPQAADSLTLNVAPLSDCTRELTQIALRGLERLLQANSGQRYEWRKAGVMLSELSPANGAPRRLWNNEQTGKYQRLMNTMDELNARFGKDTLRCGWFPSESVWRTKAGFPAPGHTIKWADILLAQ